MMMKTERVFPTVYRVRTFLHQLKMLTVGKITPPLQESHGGRGASGIYDLVYIKEKLLMGMIEMIDPKDR
ncbi:hypothetical protein ACOMHN_022344 [Nucella lapillus]